MRFEIFRSGLFVKRWYWRLVSDANGEIVAQSEGYSRRIDALATVQSIMGNAHDATVKVIEP